MKHQETTVDSGTGEIITISKTFTVQTTTEEFFMTFISSMASFFQITSITDVKVLVFLCKHADFNSGHVSLTAQKRKDMINELKLNNRQTISNSLRKLKQLGLVAGDNGEYELDPRIFWKGSTAERERFLKQNHQEILIKFTPKDIDNDPGTRRLREPNVRDTG